MNTLCERCSLPLFEHASDYMVREGHACRGDCQKVRKGGLLPRTQAEVVSGGSNAKPHKYGAVANECNQGHSHPSTKESDRCSDLHNMEKAGEIEALITHPKYPLVVNGIRVGVYTADWEYLEGDQTITEDCKSGPTKTEAYRLRVKVFEALYGHSIRET